MGQGGAVAIAEPKVRTRKSQKKAVGQAKSHRKTCSVCKESFMAKRADADVCSAKCRTKKSRLLK